MERYLPEGALRDDGLGCTLLKCWDSILCPSSLGDPESPGAGGVGALVEEGGGVRITRGPAAMPPCPPLSVFFSRLNEPNVELLLQRFPSGSSVGSEKT